MHLTLDHNAMPTTTQSAIRNPQSAIRRAAEEPGHYDATPAVSDNGPATIEGMLERITYTNPENGYTIAKLKLPRQKQPVTIAGNMPSVNVGETLRLSGKWTLHAQYGRQFTVARYEVALPGTLPGL